MANKPKLGFIFGAVAMLLAAQLAFSQSALVPKTAASGISVEVATFKLASSLMGREMPYRVILPLEYKERSQDRFPVIYLLHGLTGHYDNWTEKTRLSEYAAAHSFIIVTPEGENGWYTDSASVPKDKYESYIVRELIPEIDKKYRTVADRDNRIIAGLSMGGYGALKFGLKNPAMFSVVGSFSGALRAPQYNGSDAGTVGTSLAAAFGPADNPFRRSNDIFRIISELTAEQTKQLPFIYQSCGTEDFLIQNNRDFAALLLEKKVPHEYRQHPGSHTWAFWDAQIRDFLELVTRRFKK